ncbi:MAG: DUF4035 domain-containing protein [Ketobacter sp.]|nr:DUF4035 domain-containing protein [Ketobacter sp.]
MTSTEFSYWVAFYGLHPFGSERDNIHSAVVAATVANTTRGRNQPPYSAEDFMLKTQEDKRESDTQNVIAFLGAHAVKKDG